MTSRSTPDFSKFVPGFDFLQKLAGTSPASGAPSVSSWVAPTLDPEELERRIQDLKTVQFWLEQNTQAVAATIQALEVQRMTLATLQGMNVSMGHLAEALKVKPADPAGPAAAEPAQTTAKARAKSNPKTAAPKQAAGSRAEGAPAVDPMAWWGALTQQFQQIAGDAMKDMQDKAQKMAATAAAPEAAAQAATQEEPGRKTARATRKTPTPTRRKKT